VGSITVKLTSLASLDQPVLQIKTKIVSSHTADSKPVKQEVNRTVTLPPLVFPGLIIDYSLILCCFVSLMKKNYQSSSISQLLTAVHYKLLE
jgi:hypothetical protein